MGVYLDYGLNLLHLVPKGRGQVCVFIFICIFSSSQCGWHIVGEQQSLLNDGQDSLSESPFPNANPNHKEIPPHKCKNGYYQKDKRISIGRMWRKRNPNALLVGM